MNRRKFFVTSGALTGLGLAGAAAFLESCKKTDLSPQGPTVNFTLDLTQASNSSLISAGGWVYSNGVIVANTGTAYIAVAQTCTHQGCTVGYNQNAKDFVCPCHGGTYDSTGNVTGGPPPAPLKSYAVTLNGNMLTVAG